MKSSKAQYFITKESKSKGNKELNPIISQADLNMINPQKIRESSFINDFIRKHKNVSIGAEQEMGKESNSVSTQTEIKGRVFDDVGDDVLDEIINTSMINIGYSEFSEYEPLENPKNKEKLHISLWNKRRRSDNIALEKNSSTMSNRSSRPNLGKLSQRIKMHKKKNRFQLGTQMNSSVVFTRRNMQRLDTDEMSSKDKIKNEDYAIESISFKNSEN